VSKSGPEGKSFQIPKQLVWEAYQRVKAKKGAAGVDGQSIADFEEDLRNNLYRIWNRMSSGTYFPPAVKAVEIPKPHTGRSASGCRIGTQRLTVSAAAALPLGAPFTMNGAPVSASAFPRSIQNPQIRLAPPTYRTPPGQ